MPSSTIGHEDTLSPDEAALIEEFVGFLKDASARRYPAGTMKRFNQGRQTAFLQADFIVPEGLPDAHRVGIFAAPRTYAAWIRFANAGSESDRERDIRGMAIQLENVEGENLTPGATTQDFILNSHPVMLAASTKDFLELLRANEAGGFRRVLYFLSHLTSARIGAAARQNPSCHLDIRYLEHDPLSIRPRSHRQVRRAADVASQEPEAGGTDRHVSHRRDAHASRSGRGDVRFPGSVPC